DSIPGVASGFFYTIIAEDNCGNKDTAITGAIASFFSRSVTVVPKCPGASWANGSGNIVLTTNTNMGTATVRIIKKDNVAYGSPLVPNTVAGGVHTYNDMGPGVYILRSHENTCNKYVYDTVTVLPYQFPNLNRSTAYQCDEGGFSVSAVASLGVGPYSYQIIGSVPEFPTISSTPQSSPVFNINNGATYSLIRLRALDACGNATLGDASILPLTNNGITATSNCMHYPTTITADTVFNATYAWYKKPNLAAADSIYMGSTPGLYIPSLTLTDTGTYVCYMDVNLGCIKRTYHYRLTGSCYIVLPVQLVTFNGMQQGNLNVLQWQVRQEEDVQAYVLEKKVAGNQFASLQHQDARGAGGQQLYRAIDAAPLRGANYYRLKMINKDGTVTYSNVVVLHRQTADISCIVYPNPASNGINVRFDQAGEATYDVMLLNMRNQIVMQQRISAMQNNSVQLRRPASLPAGIYMLRINATQNNFTHSQKIIFL
ncbi:MAG: T9SS type A sorting domain-containing protein, partial [Sphingobacteriales bacterium]